MVEAVPLPVVVTMILGVVGMFLGLGPLLTRLLIRQGKTEARITAAERDISVIYRKFDRLNDKLDAITRKVDYVYHATRKANGEE